MTPTGPPDKRRKLFHKPKKLTENEKFLKGYRPLTPKQLSSPYHFPREYWKRDKILPDNLPDWKAQSYRYRNRVNRIKSDPGLSGATSEILIKGLNNFWQARHRQAFDTIRVWQQEYRRKQDSLSFIQHQYSLPAKTYAKKRPRSRYEDPIGGFVAIISLASVWLAIRGIDAGARAIYNSRFNPRNKSRRLLDSHMLEFEGKSVSTPRGFVSSEKYDPKIHASPIDAFITSLDTRYIKGRYKKTIVKDYDLMEDEGWIKRDSETGKITSLGDRPYSETTGNLANIWTKISPKDMHLYPAEDVRRVGYIPPRIDLFHKQLNPKAKLLPVTRPKWTNLLPEMKTVGYMYVGAGYPHGVTLVKAIPPYQRGFSKIVDASGKLSKSAKPADIIQFYQDIESSAWMGGVPESLRQLAESVKFLMTSDVNKIKTFVRKGRERFVYIHSSHWDLFHSTPKPYSYGELLSALERRAIRYPKKVDPDIVEEFAKLRIDREKATDYMADKHIKANHYFQELLFEYMHEHKVSEVPVEKIMRYYRTSGKEALDNFKYKHGTSSSVGSQGLSHLSLIHI